MIVMIRAILAGFSQIAPAGLLPVLDRRRPIH
jgi:hypothetical protein